MRRLTASLLTVVFVVIVLILFSPDQASARLSTPADDCLYCHAADHLTITLPGGEVVAMTVDSGQFAGSVHGQAGMTCTDCHTGYEGYPHPPRTYTTRRQFQLDHYTLCQQCHTDQYQDQLDGIHQRALAGGIEEAAICTDCHGAHRITSPDTNPRTCGNCHGEIYTEYQDSVHGAALLDNANPDVPACVDCHGVHNIEDPLTESFRLSSPDICADCHADPERMEPYGISTDVVETYVTDFHGMTVTLSQEEGPGQPVEQAVCFDCHGVHDIQSVDDSDSIRAHLLTTCQQCHPNASDHFTDAWASHYIPSPEHNTLVYSVTNFYATLLPATAAIIAVILGWDIIDWLRRLRKGKDRQA